MLFCFVNCVFPENFVFVKCRVLCSVVFLIHIFLNVLVNVLCSVVLCFLIFRLCGLGKVS